MDKKDILTLVLFVALFVVFIYTTHREYKNKKEFRSGVQQKLEENQKILEKQSPEYKCNHSPCCTPVPN